VGVSFKAFEKSDTEILIKLMQNLSEEDFSGWVATPESIQKTLDHLFLHPDKGSILVFKKEEVIVGYAILINFWSNEYKGNVLIIDELYILPEYRSQGIATAFFNYLSETRYNDSVMLHLEVSEINQRAMDLYYKMGFRMNSYTTLKKILV
jgi:GNAT superfamily N-acetyltransferase